MFTITFLMLVGYILGNIEAYVFIGCFKHNKTLNLGHGKYTGGNLSPYSCSLQCQTYLNITAPLALADKNMCYCDRNLQKFTQTGKVDKKRCLSHCQNSLNDTKYCGKRDTWAVYEAAGKDVTEPPPTECTPLDGLENGEIRYDQNRFAIVKCYDVPYSDHRLECQETNGTYSWNGTMPSCIEKEKDDEPSTATIIWIVCVVFALLVIAIGIIYFFVRKKTRASSFKIRHNSSKRLRPTIERVDGDGTYAPDTDKNHFATSQQEHIEQSVEEMPLEYNPSEDQKAGYDHLPRNLLLRPEDFSNNPYERPLDRNNANRSTYNYVTPNSTDCGPVYGDDDEDYDLPVTMDSPSCEQSYFEPVEIMMAEPEPETEPESESSQILMDIDMSSVFAPGYSRISKERGEDEDRMRDDIQDTVEHEEEELEDFYLEPNL